VKPARLTHPEVIVFRPDRIGDDRGWFMESWRDTWLRDQGVELDFVQENQSHSEEGVLRGLHYQLVRPQGKLVRVLRGAVFDVAVDLRRSSARFGQWIGRRLDDVDSEMLWIPPGFGHGFVTLSATADLMYRCTDYYYPEGDRSVRFDDAHLAIEWPADKTALRLSQKDLAAPTLDLADVFD
jgi:dTDP-4-dehydrorhamnose 3,5-epimerase